MPHSSTRPPGPLFFGGTPLDSLASFRSWSLKGAFAGGGIEDAEEASDIVEGMVFEGEEGKMCGLNKRV